MPVKDRDFLSKLISDKDSINRMANLFFIIIILCCSLNTYQRNGVWKKVTVLWSDCVLKSRHKARPYLNLGRAYRDEGMIDEAISEFKKVLIINPNHKKAHNNLGDTYYKKGRLDKAISEFKKALIIDPNLAETHSNLGCIYNK